MRMPNRREVVRTIGRGGKQIAVTVVGFVLIALGIVLLVLPGPGLLVIAAGLAVLSTQYGWAQRLLEWTKQRAKGAADRFRTSS